MTDLPNFAPLVERFFTQRLMQQRQASPHTISSYRDTFRQFLKFIEQRLHKPPARLNFEEIDAPLIVAFLDALEKHHGLSVRSRNLRRAGRARVPAAEAAVRDALPLVLEHLPPGELIVDAAISAEHRRLGRQASARHVRR